MARFSVRFSPEGMAILLALFVSSAATLFFVADLLFGKLFFGSVLPLSSLVAFWAARGLGELRERADEVKAYRYGLLVTLGLFLYFLSPSLPYFFPVSANWDGANHLAIGKFLEFYRSHRPMVSMNYNLSWGGDLKSYPWGLHAVLAAISSGTGASMLFVIHPFISLAASLIGGAWASYLFRQRAGYLSVASVVIFVALSVSYLVYFNYWSQIFGILILVSIIHLLLLAPGQVRIVPLILLLSGTVFVYPLLSPPAFAGFVLYCILSRKLGVRQILLSVGVAGVIGMLYVQPHLHANIYRVASGTGPGLWSPVFVGLLFVACHSILALQLIFRRYHYSVFPLCLLFLTAALYLFNATSYWVEKSIYSSLFLFPPALASVFSRIEEVLSRYLKRGPIYWAAALLFLVGLVFAFPANYRRQPDVAITPSEYRMLAWLKERAMDKEVFLVRSTFKLAWFEAVMFPGSIRLPPDMPKLAIQGGRKYGPGKLVYMFLRQAREGDLLAIEWNPGKPPPGIDYFVQRERVGSWLILERARTPQ